MLYEEKNENNLPILYINKKLISKRKTLSEKEIVKQIKRNDKHLKSML